MQANVSVTHVEVLGRKIQECRGGSGKPLLYLHSAGGEAIWLPHLTGLAASYELHAPAHPGFLASEGIEQIRDIEDYVYHYLAYLDVMGWKSVDVVGLSLGGWIGAELAARYPERVSKLVLVDVGRASGSRRSRSRTSSRSTAAIPRSSSSCSSTT